MTSIDQVDGCPRSTSLLPRSARARCYLLSVAGLVSLGCATGGLPPGPPIAAAPIAARLEEANPLAMPTWIEFSWSLNDRGTRVRGRGVARMEPPFRARLDLFTPNGETVARVVVVDDDIWTPPGARQDVVPAGPLLWATLGIFRPGAEATLIGARRTGERAILIRYELAGDGELRYHLMDDALDRVELLRRGHIEEEVRLKEAEDRFFPSEAVYRNLSKFQELKAVIEEVEYVEPFPPEIWDPMD